MIAIMLHLRLGITIGVGILSVLYMIWGLVEPEQAAQMGIVYLVIFVTFMGLAKAKVGRDA